MKTTILLAGGLALSLLGTGCATKKYVAKSIAPVEQRVTATEGKNGEQDQKITANAQQIESVDKDLSRTKERLTDAESKVTAAAAAAQAADAKAVAADNKAQGAQQAVVEARTAAQQGLVTLSRNVDGSLKFKELKSGTILFGLDRRTLDDAAKATLDDLARSVSGQDRYVIEIQGYADKTGATAYNEALSQDRAQAAARYLANEHNVPLRAITVLGSGEAAGEQKTREERKQARKVDVRIFVPEVASVSTTTARN
jgi:outer membrane protein OmpA-like peptidoglycan-associated protein